MTPERERQLLETRYRYKKPIQGDVRPGDEPFLAYRYERGRRHVFPYIGRIVHDEVFPCVNTEEARDD